MSREDNDRILMADAVMADLRQFDKLREIVPPLSPEEIAHRMIWPAKNVKWLLKKMGDTRG